MGKEFPELGLELEVGDTFTIVQPPEGGDLGGRAIRAGFDVNDGWPSCGHGGEDHLTHATKAKIVEAPDYENVTRFELRSAVGNLIHERFTIDDESLVFYLQQALFRLHGAQRIAAPGPSKKDNRGRTSCCTCGIPTVKMALLTTFTDICPKCKY